MKAVIGAGVALMIGAATPVPAQTPVPPSQLTARAPGIPGVSGAGMAALAKFQQQKDPVLIQLVGQLKNASVQINNEIAGANLNVEKVTALFKQIEGYQAQIRARSDDHLLQMVHALPAGDRAPFLRAVVNAKAQPQPPR